jgi:toxin ParE1/3/4
MAYHLSAAARDDVLAVAEYIIAETGSDAVAQRAVDTITRRFEILDRNPRIGRMRADLRAGVRSFRAERYIILYRVVDSNIRILRVAHTSRDLKTLMRRTER